MTWYKPVGKIPNIGQARGVRLGGHQLPVSS